MRLQARSIAVLLTLITMAFGFAAADAGAAKAPTAKSSLKSLVRQVNSLPPYAASATKRRALKRLAGHARRSARRRPCASVKDLNRFRRIVASVPVRSKGVSRKRRRAAKRLSALSPASMTASRLLLASKRTRALRRRGQAAEGRQPQGQDPEERRAPAARARGAPGRPVRAARGGRQGLDAARAPELRLSRAPRAPPASQSSATSRRAGRREAEGVGQRRRQDPDRRRRRVPRAAGPVDQDTEPPNFLKRPVRGRPFELNERAYAKDAWCRRSPPTSTRSARCATSTIGGLQIPTAQYNADSKKLVLLKSVDVTVGFVGGPHTFSEELGNPWEQFQRRLAARSSTLALLRQDRHPRDHPPLRRGDARDHQPRDARRREHLRRRAQRGGDTHARVPDRRRAPA